MRIRDVLPTLNNFENGNYSQAEVTGLVIGLNQLFGERLNKSENTDDEIILNEILDTIQDDIKHLESNRISKEELNDIMLFYHGCRLFLI